MSRDVPEYSEPITADTPGAIYDQGRLDREGDRYGAGWRMPNATELATTQLNEQIASLPKNIQDAINSGKLIPQYSTTQVGPGRDKEDVPNGITGFSSNGPNGGYYTHDLQGNNLGYHEPNRGGGGFFDKVFGGIGDLLSDPAKATTNFFENPGVKEAAIATAIAYGLNPDIFSSLGAATTGGGEAAGSLLGGGGAGTTVPEILTAGSAPGAAAATLPSYLAAPEVLGGLASIAPAILTEGSAPGSALAATTAAATPTAAELIAAGTTAGGTLSTALGNEAVASGTFTPGSLGSAAAAAGALTDAQLAAAIGAGGLGALTGADAAAAALAASPKEMVASGLSPGSAGAAGAAANLLTPAQLAAAAGTTGGGLSLLDLAKGTKTAKDLLGGSNSSKSSGIGGLGGALGLAALLAAANKKSGTDDSYKGTIPEYTASRTQTPTSETRPSVDGQPYRPGQGGISYFSPTTYTPKAADGGLMGLASGGMTPEQYNLGSYSDGGRLLKGPGDGVSDSIPAVIGQKQPARLATGEFVIPARIVSELGNGSTDAGAKRLYEMMNRIQKTRRKTKNVAANTNAAKYLPA